MRIGILGATSHIAKNIILHLEKNNVLLLFARSPELVDVFVKNEKLNSGKCKTFMLSMFSNTLSGLDAVINCIGFGTPDKVRNNSREIFAVTEYYDNLVLDYLVKSPDTVYINFSSGAIFGTDHIAAISATTNFSIAPNDIKPSDAYRISKLNSEAKHRTYEEYSIIDIRVFSFFSRFIDLDASYLLCEMVRSILLNKPFITSRKNIIRDYIHPFDLANMVNLCFEKKMFNKAIDAFSSKSVSKDQIIKAFVERYNMKVEYTDANENISPTGLKSCYFSENKIALNLLGYSPEFNSLESLIEETEVILQNRN